MLPSPMTPRTLPRGLCESTAAFSWQSANSAAEARAAVVHQVRLRKVAKMRKIAKSATASVDAAALGVLDDRKIYLDYTS